ncbi:MAG: ribonuclease HII [Deferribacteraceae bacterium]|nr:ribonuclease HII [Deferribacteraceae bacterium]
MKLVAGIDEVGRGCLAGPVVACAVILPDDYNNVEIKDSKKLSAKKRELLYDIILANALAVGLGVVCNKLIDTIGIVPATKQAMHYALTRLSLQPSEIVIDAVSLNNLPCPHIHPFKAEDSYQCVAAASIVAKVYRDRLMSRLAPLYPVYGWGSNKGYGSQQHMNAIREHGHTELHRLSFIKNI